jgi:hypothetical protein
VATITAIATMAMASVALSQSIQNAHCVSTLTQNVIYALQQQVSIDEKTDVCLNTMEAALLAMGNELQTIKFRQALLCHAVFQHICITAAPYNELEYPWQSINVHVMGTWENINDTLNLQHLRNRYWQCREHMMGSSLLLTGQKQFWKSYKVLIYLMSLNFPSGTS